jgi:hypothetical protein
MAVPGHADRVTFEYFGELTQVTQPPTAFPDAAVGDDFSFIFTFDTDAPNIARQSSANFTRGNYDDLIDAARLTVGGSTTDFSPVSSSITITDFPGDGDDFFQVNVDLSATESFLFELEDGPGLSSAELPEAPPAVSDFGSSNGGEYSAEVGFADFVNLFEFDVLGQRELGSDFLVIDANEPPLPDLGDGTPVLPPPGDQTPVSAVPTPAAALLGLPLLLAVSGRRQTRPYAPELLPTSSRSPKPLGG